MAEDQNLDDVEAVDSGVPDWVPEKFRSNPEEFAKAYTNLERSYHDSRQEVKGLQDTVQHLSDQFEAFTTQQNQPDPDLARARLLEAYETDPIALMAQIAQSTAQSIYDQQQQQSQGQPQVKPEEFASFVAKNAMTQRYEDFSELAPKIAEVIQSDPLFHNDQIWVNPDLATHAFERAYQTVKSQEILSGNAIAEKQAAETRAMKLAAQTATGAAGRTPSPDEQEQRWAEIMNAQTGKLGL